MTHSPGQRVIVTMTALGVVSYRPGTRVDFPSEELTRVLLDGQHNAHVYPSDAVHSIPQAISAAVSRLLDALRELKPEEEPAARVQLARLVDPFADRVRSAWAEERVS